MKTAAEFTDIVLPLKRDEFAPPYAHVCDIPGKHGEQQECEACWWDDQVRAERRNQETA